MVYECSTFSFAELLSNIVDNRGKTCPIDEEGLPLIATNCVKNDTLHPVFEKVRYVNQETYETWFRGHPEPGDLIFVCKGAPGNVCWTPDPVDFCIAQDMVAIRANRDIVDPKFLFALLRSQKTQADILNMHVGTMIPHFKKGDFKNLYFEIPNDKNVQKTIGEIYFSFSEKIDLNRQMNATLEAMAQALFKSWFVDFDPVIDNALAAGNPIPEPLHARAETRAALGDQRKPLPEAIQKQFPSSFVFSEEMGWIPEGWVIKKLDQLTDKITDGTHSTVKDNPDGDYYLLSCKNIKNGRILIGRSERRIDKETLQSLRKRTSLSQHDVLLTTVGTIGEVAMVRDAEIPYELQRSVAILKPDLKRCSPEFLYQFAKSKRFIHEAEARSEGSVQKCLFLGAIKSIEVLSPSIGLFHVFDGHVKTLYDKVEANSRANEVLTKTRDTLLPKLLSGQIRIPDAEKLVAEAV